MEAFDSGFFRLLMQRQYSWRGKAGGWNGTNCTWSWIGMLWNQLGQGSGPEMAWLEVAAEPQIAKGHLWAFVEVCGAARQQFITSLFSTEEHFVLVTGILTASVFHYSIANELVSLILVWYLTDQLRGLLLQRFAVCGGRCCSIACKLVTTYCLSGASLRV